MKERRMKEGTLEKNIDLKKMLLVALAITVLAAACVSGESITFGSMTGEKQKTIYKTGQDHFTVSFFNLGDETLYVKLEAVHAAEIRVEIYPANLTLNALQTQNPKSEPGSQWLILKDGKTYVESKPVEVHVRVPDKISKNLYTIKLTATARTKDGPAGSGIKQSLSQTREVFYQVYVPGDLQPSGDFEYVETEGSSRRIIYTTTLSPRGSASMASGEQPRSSGSFGSSEFTEFNSEEQETASQAKKPTQPNLGLQPDTTTTIPKEASKEDVLKKNFGIQDKNQQKPVETEGEPNKDEGGYVKFIVLIIIVGALWLRLKD